MHEYFADLHVHVGVNESGQWVKISTSRQLTLRSILQHAAEQKGMLLIGIVDAMSPLVQQDLEQLLEEGLLCLDSGGGYRYDSGRGQLSLLLGAEIESREEYGGLAHTLIFLPDLQTMKAFTRHMSRYITNINLSSQNAHMTLAKLIEQAAAFEAMIIPAHIFTPHKGLYGACTDRLSYILTDKQMAAIIAVELGLSADSSMADRISELEQFTFVTNSDAHSLDKIAREYNKMLLVHPSFDECRRALRREHGRAVTANYGLDPRLGKYHRTMCMACGFINLEGHNFTAVCPKCNSNKIVRGVFDRINAIADRSVPCHPSFRATYFYQVPLEYIPGLGKKTLTKLIAVFGNEMNIIHHASAEELAKAAGNKLAQEIVKVRSGNADIVAGAGGIYGRIRKI